ncbi:unnamed protein product [Orchesella dallaii]|uniref:Uncharacterized protein n=1 Tax=Orchesella dallaii TaxID=48710 RepID=A0ABP1R5D2_9HEXA
MERNPTQKNNFGKAVQESDTKNSSNGSSTCIMRERVPTDNGFESERATFMSTLTNEHVLSVDMPKGLSSESVPIVIGKREIGEKSGNKSEPDYDEEDPKQKEKLKLSFRGVKMLGVVDKRAYVENYLLCNACNFRVPTPKKGFSTFLDIASGMIEMKQHFKALHKEEHKALKYIPPLPKELPKSKSKKGRKQSGAVNRPGRPKSNKANEQSENLGQKGGRRKKSVKE